MSSKKTLISPPCVEREYVSNPLPNSHPSWNFEKRLSRGAIDQKKVVGIGIGCRCQVSVIELCRTLESEVEAHVAVSIFLASLFHIQFHDKVPNPSLRQHRQIERRTMLRFVLALLMKLDGSTTLPSLVHFQAALSEN